MPVDENSHWAPQTEIDSASKQLDDHIVSTVRKTENLYEAQIRVDWVRYFPHIGRSGNGKDKNEGQHGLRGHACMQATPELC